MIKSQMKSNYSKGSFREHGKDGSDARPQWNPLLGLADALTGNRFDFDGAGSGSSPPDLVALDPNKGGARAGSSVVEDKELEDHLSGLLLLLLEQRMAILKDGQTLHNQFIIEPKSGVYGGGETDIRKLLLAKGQYEPTWKFPRPAEKIFLIKNGIVLLMLHLLQRHQEHLLHIWSVLLKR